MQEITMPDGRQAVVLEVASPGELRIPLYEEPFLAVIWGSTSFTADERHEVATALIESGCHYMVCGGTDCDMWDDDADMAHVIRYIEAEEAPFLLMTTWHTGESVEYVLDFALHSTSSAEDAQAFRKHLVLIMGRDAAVRDRFATLLATDLDSWDWE